MIKSRIAPYLIALLFAAVLSLLPPAIFADLITPFDSWNNWYSRGERAGSRLDGNNPPPFLQRELVIFRVLAAPPSWMREQMTGYPTVYGAHFGQRGII